LHGIEQDSGDHELADWLAARTDTDTSQVAAELELGRRRREHVVDELVEAGFTGSELLDHVVRLTGVDRSTARSLIAPRTQAVPAAEAETASSKRDEQLAENEVMFRRVNERIASAEHERAAPHELELVCECSDRDCVKVLRIEVAEYEWLRLNSRRFAVLPGHDAPAVEDVVERHAGFVVVEKHAGTHGQVDAADPRS
jgi:hypothetical protein